MIDIIIPVYNTPIKDLERCFFSFEKQTYEHWQAIIVDDGSKTEIAEYLDYWQSNHTRFKIIHSENKGVSHARNLGLDNSDSEYFCFCDSDDTFTENFLQSALDLLQAKNLDVVIGGVKTIDENGKILELLHSEEDFIVFDKGNMPLFIDYALVGKNRKENVCLGNSLVARPYSKIYCANLRNQIRYNEKISMHEDNLYSFDIFLNCQRVGVSSEIWYDYYQNCYSLTHARYNPKRIPEEIFFAEAIYKRLCLFPDDKPVKIRLALIFIQILALLTYEKNVAEKIKEILSTECFAVITWKQINEISKLYIGLSKKQKLYIKILGLKFDKIKTFMLVSLIWIHKILRPIKRKK